MLTIYKSNQMEKLVDVLIEQLQKPLNNPVLAEHICVQSRGMKTWISSRIASTVGICANTRFVFPKDIVLKILEAFNHNTSTKFSDKNFIFWKALDQLYKQEGHQQWRTLSDYVQNDNSGIKKFQIADRLSNLFDDYQVYRPQMVLNWLSQSDQGIQTSHLHEKWQQQFFKQILKSTDDHYQLISETALKFLSGEKTVDLSKWPSRISFIGMASLPPLFMDIFARMARHLDIHFFLLAPSDQYFFDVLPEVSIRKNKLLKKAENLPVSDLHYFVGNPLLAGLGNCGKQFFEQLETFDYVEPYNNLFHDPMEHQKTILSVIQSDILNLVNRSRHLHQSRIKVSANDNSISIHSCHSPMRETQVLKDLLIDTVLQDPDISLHDIVVMMPDIETYAPYIQTVFSSETTFDFSISDRKRRSESQVIQSFLKILQLPKSRLYKSEILNLMAVPEIMSRFQFDQEDLIIAEKIIDTSGILWGIDDNDRKTLGFEPIYLNTWQFGIERILMGMAMPDQSSKLVHGVSPLNKMQGRALDTAGKLIHFANMCLLSIERLQGDKDISQWCKAFSEILPLFFNTENNHLSEDAQFIISSIDEYQNSALKSDFNHAVSLDMALEGLKAVLDQSFTQGRFLAGGITFCNLMPMRSIPFKVVALMGMDEAGFPKKNVTTGFDLIKLFPKPMDKNPREEDRYLFLETLLCARKKLIITYTGRKISDNTRIPVSCVVDELCDTINSGFEFPEDFRYVYDHQLHPFDYRYFQSGTRLFSFSASQRKIARRLLKKDVSKSKQDQTAQILIENQITLDFDALQIFKFFSNPIQYFLKERLDIQLAEIKEVPKDRELFLLDGLSSYTIGQQILSRDIPFDDFDSIHALIQAKGALPWGDKGKQELDKIFTVCQLIFDAGKEISSKEPLAEINKRCAIGSCQIAVNFNNIYPEARITTGFVKSHGHRILNIWIDHLLYVCSKPDHYPDQTIAIFLKDKNKIEIEKLSFTTQKAKAASILENLMGQMVKGHEIPFLFWPQISYPLSQIAQKNNFEISDSLRYQCLRKAYEILNSSSGTINLDRQRYMSIFVDLHELFENQAGFNDAQILENSISVYRPLLESLEQVL